MTIAYGDHWRLLRDRVVALAPEVVDALDLRYDADPSLAETELSYLIEPPADDATVTAAARYFAS